MGHIGRSLRLGGARSDRRRRAWRLPVGMGGAGGVLQTTITVESHIMFTTPEHPLLERKRIVTDHARYITDVSSPLREILNKSVHQLDLCVAAIDALAEPYLSHHHITLHLFRRCIVLTDAVEALVSQVCLDGLAPTLRSALETQLGFVYLLNGERHARKAHAWFYVWLLESIRRADRMSNTALRAACQQRLADEPMRSITPEYARAQRQQNRKRPQRARPKWYSLFDGPRNVADLVQRVFVDDAGLDLDGPDPYESYRTLSASIHAMADIEHTYPTLAKPLKISPIRHTTSTFEDSRILPRFGAFLMMSTHRMVSHYLPATQRSEYIEWSEPTLKKFMK